MLHLRQQGRTAQQVAYLLSRYASYRLILRAEQLLEAAGECIAPTLQHDGGDVNRRYVRSRLAQLDLSGSNG